MAGKFLSRRPAAGALAGILRALFSRRGNRFHLLQYAGGGHDPPLGRAHPGLVSVRVQTSAEITHDRALCDCETELSSFLRALEPLGEKLHVILVQLPPSFAPKTGRPALRAFLEQLPRDFRFAIEFRHPGWHRPQIIRLLEKHRVCWVWADTSPLNERNLAPFEFLPRTTDFLYLRLLGDYATKYDPDGERVHRYGKLLWKREAALESWALKIERHLAETRSVWSFVNNHFEGFAPETCQRLAKRLGFELALPSAEETASADPGQLDFFWSEL